MVGHSVNGLYEVPPLRAQIVGIPQASTNLCVLQALNGRYFPYAIVHAMQLGIQKVAWRLKRTTSGPKRYAAHCWRWNHREICDANNARQFFLVGRARIGERNLDSPNTYYKYGIAQPTSKQVELICIISGEISITLGFIAFSSIIFVPLFRPLDATIISAHFSHPSFVHMAFCCCRCCCGLMLRCLKWRCVLHCPLGYSHTYINMKSTCNA